MIGTQELFDMCSLHTPSLPCSLVHGGFLCVHTAVALSVLSLGTECVSYARALLLPFLPCPLVHRMLLTYTLHSAVALSSMSVESQEVSYIRTLLSPLLRELLQTRVLACTRSATPFSSACAGNGCWLAKNTAKYPSNCCGAGSMGCGIFQSSARKDAPMMNSEKSFFTCRMATSRSMRQL